MIYTVPFEVEHYARMGVQPAQQWMKTGFRPEDLKTLENDYAVTLMVDGEPAACAGAVEYWPGRALVWAVLGDAVDAQFFPVLHREAKLFLDGLPMARLEAAVDCDFDAGHRWAKALGFKVEAERMRKFHMDGRDCALYARVRD